MTRWRVLWRVAIAVAAAVLLVSAGCSTSAEIGDPPPGDTTQPTADNSSTSFPAIEPTAPPIEAPTQVPTAPPTAIPTEVPTAAPTPTVEVPTAVPQLAAMSGFCALAPLEEITALFPEAALDRTVGIAEGEQDCEVAIKNALGTQLSSFTLSVFTDTAPGGFDRANDALFESLQGIAESLGDPPPTREPLDIGDQAEYMSGFRTQVAILEGATLWLVFQGSSDRALPRDELIAVALALFDNRPSL